MNTIGKPNVKRGRVVTGGVTVRPGMSGDLGLTSLLEIMAMNNRFKIAALALVSSCLVPSAASAACSYCWGGNCYFIWDASCEYVMSVLEPNGICFSAGALAQTDFIVSNPDGTAALVTSSGTTPLASDRLLAFMAAQRSRYPSTARTDARLAAQMRADATAFFRSRDDGVVSQATVNTSARALGVSVRRAAPNGSVGSGPELLRTDPLLGGAQHANPPEARGRGPEIKGDESPE